MTHLTLKMMAVIASSLVIVTLAQAETRSEKRLEKNKKMNSELQEKQEDLEPTENRPKSDE